MKTFLYDRHLARNAKMIDFFGWDLPLSFSGALDEYAAVREKAALFDVSHMLKIDIVGEDAEVFLNRITTNKLKSEDHSVTYTLITNEKGTIVDDTLVSRVDKNHFFIVANGSRRDADLEHLRNQKKSFRVEIIPNEGGIIALQGPESEKYFSPMNPFTFREENGVIISATGYTGEKGFELMGSPEKLLPIWDDLTQKVKPAGLGARDILRLEKGYALYGHELNEDLRPLETISAWAVKNKEYLGRNQEPLRHFAYGVKLKGKAIPREGYPVFQGDKTIGTVTSGGFSPALKTSIALILSDQKLSVGTPVEIEIRGRKEMGEIVKTPFI